MADRVDPEKTEQDIRAAFYRHTETRSCVHGLHGYMASDGVPWGFIADEPTNPELQLLFE